MFCFNLQFDFFIDAPLFPSDHELLLKTETNSDKPKRKRGRPPKPPPEVLEALRKEQDAALELAKKETELKDISDDDDDGSGEFRKKRRRIKIPSRFQEAVQGKELERIYVEKGVIEKPEIPSDFDENDDGFDNYNDDRDEVIGHLQGNDGSTLGDLVLVNGGVKSRTSRKSKTKFMCDICNRAFTQEIRFLNHRKSHHNVRFECKQCLEQFEDRAILSQHQVNFGHEGEGIIENLAELIDSAGTDIIESDKENMKLIEEEEEEQDEFKIFEDKTNLELKSDNAILYEVVTFDENPPPEPEQPEQQHNPKIDNQTKIIQDAVPVQKKRGRAKKFKPIEDSTTGDLTDKFSCDICSKIFNHPSSVIYHKESEHSNGRRFVCSKCNKSFKHKQLLQRHQNVHSTKRPHSCDVCQQGFKSRANLLNHLSTHTKEKKHECPICQQTFAHKTSLTLHIRWHKGEKPYFCKICGKTFSQNGNLQEHLRIHTGEKPYRCSFCSRDFTTSSQCKLHIKRHEGARPFACEYCPKTFLHLETFKTHTRRHKNERPYVCEFCTRGFTEHWALKKHIRSHTGEKPYNCNKCNKQYSDCSNLAKHRRTHCNEPETITDEVNTNFEVEVLFTVAPSDNLEIPEQQQIQQTTETEQIPIFDAGNGLWHTFTNPDEPSDSNEIIYVTYGQSMMGQITELENETKNEIVNETNQLSIQLCENDVQEIHENSADVLLDIESEHQNLNEENIFDESTQPSFEFITSDGKKIKLMTNYTEDPLDFKPDY